MNPKHFGAYLLAATLIISIGLSFAASRIRFDYNFENFFPIGDPDLEHYGQFRNRFENDNDYLLIGIENDQGVFKIPFLRKVQLLCLELKALPEVSRVMSITENRRPIKTPTGWVQVPLVHLENPLHLKRDSLRISRHPFLNGNLVSADGRAITIVVKHRPDLEKPLADPFLERIETLLAPHQFERVHIAGKIKAQSIYIEKMKEELLIFMSASLVLVSLFLFIGYRSLWGVAMPICIVLLSIIWILGTMSLLGKSLDLLMILLPPIMFVVGMSDIIHLLSRYIEELRMGRVKALALKTAIKEVGFATFLTTLTTSIGFFTLLTSSIAPIREFGFYTGIGVFLALFITYGILAPVLMFRSPPRVALKYTHHNFWKAILSSGFGLVLRHPRAIVLGSILSGFVALWGISRIEINSYLIDDIPLNDPLKQDFVFFDQKFSGSRPFEMSLKLMKEGSAFTDWEVLQEIEKIEKYLEANEMVDGLVSPNYLVKTFHQGMKGGQESEFRIPADGASLEQLQRREKQIINSGIKNAIIDSTGTWGRISGRMVDVGSSLSLKQSEELRAFLAQSINSGIVLPTYTGTSLLIDKNNLYLSSNLMLGLALAFGAVALISGLLYRSLRMIFITLVPNTLPLLIVAGIMGFSGMDLKLSTSIIFTIAFGIAVDDTIHFLSKLNLELKKGRQVLYAIKRTYYSTGKAIIVTSSILIGGFLILILSGFEGTFYTGLLVSLTLLLALVIDLTLLPILLIWLYSPKART